MFDFDGLPDDCAEAQGVLRKGSDEDHLTAHSASDSQSRTPPVRIRLRTDEQSNPPTAATDQDWESVADSQRSVSHRSFENSFDVPTGLLALRQEFTDQLRELEERLNAQIRIMQVPLAEKDAGNSASMVSLQEFASSLATERAQREEAVRRSVAIADDLSKCKERLEALESNAAVGAEEEEERCQESELPEAVKAVRRSRQKASSFSKVEALELKVVGFEHKFASELAEVAKLLTGKLDAHEARLQKDAAQRPSKAESAPEVEVNGTSVQSQLSQLSARFQEVEREVSSVSHLQKRVEALENTQGRVTDDALDSAHNELEQVFQQVLAMQIAQECSPSTDSLHALPAKPENAAWVVGQNHSGNGYYSSCESDLEGRRASNSSFAMTFDKEDEFSDCLTKEDLTCGA